MRFVLVLFSVSRGLGDDATDKRLLHRSPAKLSPWLFRSCKLLCRPEYCLSITHAVFVYYGRIPHGSAWRMVVISCHLLLRHVQSTFLFASLSFLLFSVIVAKNMKQLQENRQKHAYTCTLTRISNLYGESKQRNKHTS